MKNFILVVLFLVGYGMFAQPFIHKESFEYKVTSKMVDTVVTNCGGVIKFKMTGKERYFGFAHGRISIETCDYKAKGRFVSLPYYDGLEFFDISLKKPHDTIRIIMYEGLFGVYHNDTLLSFYDTIKEDRK